MLPYTNVNKSANAKVHKWVQIQQKSQVSKREKAHSD